MLEGLDESIGIFGIAHVDTDHAVGSDIELGFPVEDEGFAVDFDLDLIAIGDPLGAGKELSEGPPAPWGIISSTPLSFSEPECFEKVSHKGSSPVDVQVFYFAKRPTVKRSKSR